MDTERTGSATQPFIAPPPAAEGGASSPPETFHELVGRLTLPLWGLTALSVADEIGLLDALGEPQSVDSLAAGSELAPRHVEAIGDVLVAIGAARREGDTFAAAPVISHVVARRPQR